VLTFKEWQTLNESFGAYSLGLGQPNSVIGVFGAQLEEAKAKEKAKAKGKKKMLGDEEVIDAEEDDDVEEEPEEIDDKEVVKKDIKKDVKDSDDEEETEEEDEEETEEDDDKKDIATVEPKNDVEKDGSPKTSPEILMSKKKCKKCNKSDKKMSKENQEWYDNVMSQLNADPNKKFWDGISKIQEDSVIPPEDQNSKLIETEPKPGEVGYAPIPRLSDWFAN
jgi:uncharacterized protein YggL (DUF469 family)